MHTLVDFFNFVLHIDRYLLAFVAAYGTWTYLILFLIVFCETGLVVTPFLPGDSLLFVAGSVAAQANSPLSLMLLFLLLVSASILGNQLNYWIGKALGPRVFSTNSRLLNKKHLQDTHRFYEKHGGKTILLARFIPIIRTFAPFVAGIGFMNTTRFSLYNAGSAILWIGSLLGFGYFFGSLPVIRENLTSVIYGIILISLLPPVIGFLCREKGLDTEH
ncbi:MAG: DedA family protein [Tatlockia sp.]|jgi:membrane-associated protein